MWGHQADSVSDDYYYNYQLSKSLFDQPEEKIDLHCS